MKVVNMQIIPNKSHVLIIILFYLFKFIFGAEY